MSDRDGLERRLGTWDVATITVGSIVGTGIFFTTGDMVRSLGHPALVLGVWLVAGLLTLAGALTFAELGVLFPRAGGIYHFLKEGLGPFWGFLYGWTAFLVINTGGLAAIAVGLGESVGTFVPALAVDVILWQVALGEWTWRLNGAQVSAVAALLLLTVLNDRGLREGALVQGVLTLAKAAVLALFALVGLGAAATQLPALAATPLPPLEPGRLALALAAAGVAAMWAYDGWYCATFSAGEVREPGDALPWGLVGGTAAVIGLYLLVNLAYLALLPGPTLAGTTKVGEVAAVALLGEAGGRLAAAAILLSILGCLASNLLATSRVYLPMAEDGLFFRAAAAIHPTRHTPTGSLWMQTAWAAALTLSGTYRQLYTYVTFASVGFYALAGIAFFVLRARRPELPRAYRTWGAPWVPALFVAATVGLMGATLVESPRESLAGLGLVALGVPVWFWRTSGSAPANG